MYLKWGNSKKRVKAIEKDSFWKKICENIFSRKYYLIRWLFSIGIQRNLSTIFFFLLLVFLKRSLLTKTVLG